MDTDEVGAELTARVTEARKALEDAEAAHRRHLESGAYPSRLLLTDCDGDRIETLRSESNRGQAYMVTRQKDNASSVYLTPAHARRLCTWLDAFASEHGA